ncbi:MAG: DUF481 domain-containing protein [Kiritimatiellae bacterium]|nr:DUF481 domain-containing protein [Kiritimatiellia bacterium]
MQLKTITALVLTAFATAAFADKVNLKSGSFLTGKVGAIDGSTIAFESDDLGEITIEIEKIASIEDSETMHVVQYDDFSTKELALTVKDGVITLDDKKFDEEGVKKIDPVEETWHGSVNVGFNATRGNTYDNNWSVIANLSRRWERDRFTGDVGYYYAESGTTGGRDKQKTEDRIVASAQHDHFWTQKFYHFENGKYEKDKIQLLDRRIRLGLGLGYQWAEDSLIEKVGSWDFAQEAGANWIEEKFDEYDSDTDDDFAAIMYAHHLKFRPIFKEDVEFFHNLEYLPQVNDFERYLITTDVGVTTKLIYNWDLLAKIEWDYNSRPAMSRKRSDYRYIVGLGYKW